MLYYPDLLTYVEQSRRRLSAIMVQACLPTKNPVMDLAPNLSSVSWFENTLVCLEVDTPPFHEERVQKVYILYPPGPHPMLSLHLACIQLCSLKNVIVNIGQSWETTEHKEVRRSSELVADWSEVSGESESSCTWLVRNVGRGLRHLLVGFWSVGDPGACTVLNWWILH